MLQDLVVYLLIALFGLFTGVIVNYLADVLPWKRKLAKPFCLNCDQNQSFGNYFLWPRRCPHCTTFRGWRTWVVELVYGILILWIWVQPPHRIGFLGGWIILTYFGLIVVIDMEHRLILHPLSWVGAGIGFLIGLFRNGWLDTLIGGVVGYGLMWFLYWLGELTMKGLARLRHRTLDDVAFGLGDVNLSGVLGLMLGWPLILPGLVIAIFIGGLISFVYLVLMLALRRYRLFTALPYGPFLIAGAIAILFFGEALNAFLLR
jgi:leader peptidase (prepilin peptidase)/N-methyltransferase